MSEEEQQDIQPQIPEFQFDRDGILCLAHSLVIFFLGSSITWQLNHVNNNIDDTQNRPAISVLDRIGRFAHTIGRVVNISQNVLLKDVHERAKEKKAFFNATNPGDLFAKLVIERSESMLSYCTSNGRLEQGTYDGIHKWFDLARPVILALRGVSCMDQRQLQTDLQRFKSLYVRFKRVRSQSLSRSKPDIHFCPKLLLIHSITLAMSIANREEIFLFSPAFSEIFQPFSKFRDVDLTRIPTDLEAPYHMTIPFDELHEINKDLFNNKDVLAEDIAKVAMKYVPSQLMHLAIFTNDSNVMCDSENMKSAFAILQQASFDFDDSRRRSKQANRTSYSGHRKRESSGSSRKKNLCIHIATLNYLGLVCGSQMTDCITDKLGEINSNSNGSSPRSNEALLPWMNNDMMSGNVTTTASLTCDLRCPSRLVILGKEPNKRKRFSEDEKDVVRAGFREGKYPKEILDGSDLLQRNGRTNASIKDLCRTLFPGEKLPNRRPRCPFSQEEKEFLLQDRRSGMDWSDIRDKHPEFASRKADDLRQCYRYLTDGRNSSL